MQIYKQTSRIVAESKYLHLFSNSGVGALFQNRPRVSFRPRPNPPPPVGMWDLEGEKKSGPALGAARFAIRKGDREKRLVAWSPHGFGRQRSQEESPTETDPGTDQYEKDFSRYPPACANLRSAPLLGISTAAEPLPAQTHHRTRSNHELSGKAQARTPECRTEREPIRPAERRIQRESEKARLRVVTVGNGEADVSYRRALAVCPRRNVEPRVRCRGGEMNSSLPPVRTTRALSHPSRGDRTVSLPRERASFLQCGSVTVGARSM